MQTFAETPDAIRADTPALPDRDGFEHGFTYLDFGDAALNQPLRVAALSAGPFHVHHLVNRDGQHLKDTGFGITLDPGGYLFHFGRVYFRDLDDALAMAARLLELPVNWYEPAIPDDVALGIRDLWQAALDAGQLADGSDAPANWPPLPGPH
ncbi:hypothetical protein [Maricaulis sp.]|uniref:hypothetical protein n=1 Tax=Maricaulis sp. TaxID=1486257 RepID=UPI0032968900